MAAVHHCDGGVLPTLDIACYLLSEMDIRSAYHIDTLWDKAAIHRQGTGGAQNPA